MPEAERAEILAALACVDAVVDLRRRDAGGHHQAHPAGRARQGRRLGRRRHRRARHRGSPRRQSRARPDRAGLVDIGDHRENSQQDRAMKFSLQRSPLTIAWLAVVCCTVQTACQDKTYIVTKSPVDVGMASHGLCVAVDETDPHGIPGGTRDAMVSVPRAPAASCQPIARQFHARPADRSTCDSGSGWSAESGRSHRRRAHDRRSDDARHVGRADSGRAAKRFEDS